MIFQATIEDIECIRFNRTISELEHFLMFAVSVAGKSARQIVQALNNFWTIAHHVCDKHSTPFAYLQDLVNRGELGSTIVGSRLGQHTKLLKAFTQLASLKLDLRVCGTEELEEIHGVSFKTSRFFLTFNRPNLKLAALDTHVLAELRSLGYKDIPKSTPQSKKRYAHIEKLFLEYARSKKMKPTELDLEIWLRRSKK